MPCVVTLVVSCLVVGVHTKVGVMITIKVQELRLLLLKEAWLGSTTPEGIVAVRGEGIFVILWCHNHCVGTLLAHLRTIWATRASTVHENCLILHQTRLVARPDWLVTTILRWAHVVWVLILLTCAMRLQTTQHRAYMSAAHLARIHHCVRVMASNAHGIRRSGLLHKWCLTRVMHVLFRHHALIRHLLSIHVLNHSIVSLLLLRLRSLTVISVLVGRWCLGFRSSLLSSL